MPDKSTDSAPTKPPSPATGRALPIAVIAQYLKDLSFENPNAPGVVHEAAEAPQGSVQVDVRAASLGSSNYEVTLHLRVEAQQKTQLAYLIELEYAGLFRIGNVPPEAVEPLVMIEGPRLLFPFARQIVMNATRDGGFAALLINPIDFAALYRDHRQQAQRQAAEAEAG